MRFPAPIALPLLAAGLAAAARTGAHAADLNVALNHSVRLALAGRAGSVVVGNPAVADVTVVDSRTVFLVGKATGATDVTVVDPAGRIVYRADVDVVPGYGRPVTVHHGAERVDMACDPRCGGTAAPKSSGNVVDETMKMQAARAATAPGQVGAGAAMGAAAAPLGQAVATPLPQ